MSQVYARELIQSMPDVRKFDVIKEEFNIVIDNMEFILEFRITQFWWCVEIKHPWILEEEEEEDCHDGTNLNQFVYLSQSEHKRFFPEFSDGGQPLTEEIVKLFLDKIIAEIDGFTFNKKEGLVMDKSLIRKQIARRCCFGKFIKVEESDKCSICLDEDIQTKTPCGHTLCIPCWSKLRAKPICPICRGDISYRRKL